MADLAKVSGHVDVIGRAIVSIVSVTTGDPFLATVDTGFNRALLTSTQDAPTLGVRLGQKNQPVVLGDGRSVLLQRGNLVIDWLGARREVDVHIGDEPSRGGDGRPLALIGALVLSPHLLLVDYAAQTVEIETQA